MSLFSYVPGTGAWRRRRDARLCMQTHDQIQAIVDGEIGPGRAEQVLVKHLEVCKSCDHEADAIRDLKQAIARVACQADQELVTKLEALAKRLCEERERPPAE